MTKADKPAAATEPTVLGDPDNPRDAVRETAACADQPVVEERITLNLLGGPIVVRIHGDALPAAPALREAWAHLSQDPSAVPSAPEAAPQTAEPTAGAVAPIDEVTVEALEGDETVPVSVRIARTTYCVSGRITHRLLNRSLGQYVLLHSGAVDHERYGTVLLIAPSGMGKSTLSTLMAREGLYLSDELAIVHPDTFEVTAYPKPVSRIDSDGVKRDLALPSLGLTPGFAASAPSHLLLLARDRREDPSVEPHLLRLPMSRAIPRIIEQSSSMWRLPNPLGTLARLLETVGGALEVHYCEAEQVPALLENPPEPLHEQYAVVTPQGEQRANGDGTVASRGLGTLRVTPFVQALICPDGLVVLKEASVVRLDGLGALIWDLLQGDGPMTREELLQALRREMGPHPEDEKLLDQSVRSLITESLLE